MNREIDQRAFGEVVGNTASPDDVRPGPLQQDAVSREVALKRLQRKRKVVGDVVAYVVVNAFLLIVWAMTDRSYFWPGWVLSGWGVLLTLDIWNAFLRRPITAAEIEREMHSVR